MRCRSSSALLVPVLFLLASAVVTTTCGNSTSSDGTGPVENGTGAGGAGEGDVVEPGDDDPGENAGESCSNDDDCDGGAPFCQLDECTPGEESCDTATNGVVRCLEDGSQTAIVLCATGTTARSTASLARVQADASPNWGRASIYVKLAGAYVEEGTYVFVHGSSSIEGELAFRARLTLDDPEAY